MSTQKTCGWGLFRERWLLVVNKFIKRAGGERGEGAKGVLSVLLLGRCVGDSLGVCLFMPGTF